MDKLAAIQGDYCGLRFIKSRKVAVIEIEIPIERGAEFVATFGAPDTSTGVPVALARIDPKASHAPAAPEAQQPRSASAPERGEHRSWAELSPAQQAGIRCNDPLFQRFMKERKGVDDAADGVRGICGVASRSQLTGMAAGAWRALDDEFVLWQRYPELAA